MNKKYIILFLFIFLIVFTVNSLANNNQYQLNKGDKLYISVWGHTDLNKEAVVGPNGNISFPLVGELKVENFTVPEVKEKIQEKLATYIKNPEINVNLIEYRKPKIMILGEVKNPGTYEIRENDRILDIISLAGGPTEIADLSNINVKRNNNNNYYDLSHSFTEEKNNSTENNIILQANDTIYIPKSTIKITVLGEVVKPDNYDVKKGTSLNDILARAGGAKKTADLKNVKLRRNNENNYHNLENDDNEKSIELKDGDIVEIPTSLIEVTILGEVRQPGQIEIKKGSKISDLFAKAGGLTENAANNATYSSSKQKQSISVQSIISGESDKNYQLKDKDEIFIPETTKEVSILGEINNPGSYKWHEDLRLIDLMAQAGNYTDTGDIKEIKINNINDETRTINLMNYLEKGNNEANPRLKEGDTVVIPKLDSGSKVTILGEVNKPGHYPWEKGLQLVDLLAQAGNKTDRGDIEQIQLIHENGDREIINLEKLFNSNQKENNPSLKPGDIVVVNELNTINWQNFFSVVTGLNGLKNFLEIDW